MSSLGQITVEIVGHPSSPQDLKAVLQLHKVAKNQGKLVFNPQNLAEIQSLTSQPGSMVAVAKLVEAPGETAQVIGAAVCSGSQQMCDLASVVVRADCRQQGVGKALLASLCAHLETSSMHTLTCNVRNGGPALVKLLSSSGFHHGAGHDSQVYMKTLGNPPSASPAAASSSSQPEPHQHSSSSSNDYTSKLHEAVESVPGVVAQKDDLMITRMQPQHLQPALELHRNATWKGKPVFGSGQKFEGVQDMLHYMATQPAPGVEAWVAVRRVSHPQEADQEYQVLGVITAEIEDSNKDSQPNSNQLVVLTAVVDGQLQRQGLAKTLLDVILAKASEYGASRIVTDVAGNNEAALQFFRKHGFVNKVARSAAETAVNKSGFGGVNAAKGKKKCKQTAASNDQASVEMVLTLMNQGPAHASESSAHRASQSSRPSVACTAMHVPNHIRTMTSGAAARPVQFYQTSVVQRMQPFFAHKTGTRSSTTSCRLLARGLP